MILARYSLIILFMAACLLSRGQQLKIGQTLPGLEFSHVINHSSSTLKLADYKGKLVIFDFWGTGCSACIKAFPKIDTLQKQFEGRVQFILVNKESEDSTRRFLQRKTKIKLPSVPCITGDKVLHRYLPHVYVPHHVWLDGNRKILAITDGHNATAKHISEALAGESISLHQKKEIWRKDYSKPLIAEADSELVKTPFYYSFLMPEVPALVNARSLWPNRVVLNRKSVLQLVEIAFNEGTGNKFLYPGTVALQVKDSAAFLWPEAGDELDQWHRKHSYYYELSVPPSMKNRLYKFMQQDLVRFFNLEVRIEKQPVKTLVLLRTSTQDKLKTRGGKPGGSLFVDIQPEKFLQNKPFERLSAFLGIWAENLHLPFMDETGYNGNIDIALSTDILNSQDLAGLRKELAKYDLDLKEENRSADVLVIKEKE